MGNKKIVKIDSQILNAFSKCERDFELSFIRNLMPLSYSYSIQRGSLVHDIIMKYYEEYKASRNRLASSVKAVEFGRANITKYESIDVPRGMEILENMKEYFVYYQGEKWLPVDIEKIHKKVIYEDEEIVILYVAKIDATVIGEDQIPLLPVDHKSYDRWFDPLALENQFTGYCHVLDVDYLTVNKIGFQKTYPPEKKFRRVKLNISKFKREEWVHNTARIVKDMIFAMENNVFTMRRTQCGMYGGCSKLPICEVDPRAREGIIEKLYKATKPWNPEEPVEVG